MNYNKNNQVYVCGEIVSNCLKVHENHSEKFYEYHLAIKRLSGTIDILPITISEKLLGDQLQIGDKISAIGQMRSFNRLEDGKSHLKLTVFILDLLEEPKKNLNKILLFGYICKPVIYRLTPANREIADIILAVNRPYGKSDYIPLIFWGRNAKFVKDLSVGDKIAISGRIQSREYQKKSSNNEIELKTAYEVSVSQVLVVDNDTDFDINKEFGDING